MTKNIVTVAALVIALASPQGAVAMKRTETIARVQFTPVASGPFTCCEKTPVIIELEFLNPEASYLQLSTPSLGLATASWSMYFFYAGAHSLEFRCTLKVGGTIETTSTSTMDVNLAGGEVYNVRAHFHEESNECRFSLEVQP